MSKLCDSEFEQIFHEARGLEAADDRAAFLDDACLGRAGLRQQVEALLSADDQVGSFMAQDAATALNFTLDVPIRERPGSQIGRYKLLEEIGEGGFGLVFLAQQHDPIDRRVALKVVKPGMDTREVIARFEAERQALALMDHPHIAKVLDGGATESGRPYFVMEWVRGLPITEYCDRSKCTLRERLYLFNDLGKAVQHAHQKGIIHRDLKPTNVLVTEQDGRPTVKIIDFGVAKALDRQLSRQIIYTRFHQMIGTPVYMSPEQAGMSSLDVDTRSDIYSLGVLLYELLTGSTPFDRQRLAHGALEQMQRIIREEDPPKPSTKLGEAGDRLASIAAARQTEPARLTKLMRGDLDWIVMKCLEKDRNRRYDTALGLAHDVERYLHDEPVQASPPSRLYRWRKYARKHRVPLIIGTAFLLLLMLGLGIATWQAVRVTRSEREAASAALRTERVLDFLISAFRKPDPAIDGREVKVVDVLQQAMEDAKAHLADDPLQQAAVMKAIGQTLDALDSRKAALQALELAVELFADKFGEDHRTSLVARNRLAIVYQHDGQLGKAIRILEDVVMKLQTTLGAEDLDTIESMADLAEAHRDAGHLEKAVALNELCLNRSQRTFGEDHEATHRVMHNLALAYHEFARYDDAVGLLEKQLKSDRVKYGDNHPNTLESINNLARTYRAAGRSVEAVALFEEALQRMQAVFGKEHQSTLTTMSGTADAYLAVGRLPDALELGQSALNSERQLLGEDHPTTLHTMTTVAVILDEMGRWDEARILYEKGLQLCESKLGREHPLCLTMLGNLARAYTQVGRVEEAIQLHEEELSLSQQILGEDHPDSLCSMSNLAVAYEQAGLIEKALPLYETELEMCRQKLGDAHPDTLISMNNVAGVRVDLGRLDEGLRLCQLAVELCRATLGQDHPQTLRSVSNLARGFQASGEWQKALPLFQEALSLRRSKLGDDHPDTLSSIRALASAHQDAGELDKALPLLEQARELQRAKLGDDHGEVLATSDILLGVYLDAGDFEEALPLAKELLRLRRSTLDRDHPHVVQSVNNLAVVYLSAGEFEQALPLLEEAVTWLRTNRGDHHPHTLKAMGNLAVLYGRTGQLEKAMLLQEETLRRSRAKLGDDHPETLRNAAFLTRDFIAAGAWEKALPFGEETVSRFRARLGKEHPRTLGCMRVVADGYRSAGMFCEALSLYQDLLSLTQAQRPDSFPSKMMHGLAGVYMQLHRHGDSTVLLHECVERARKLLPRHDPKFAAVLRSVAQVFLLGDKHSAAEDHLRECLQIRQAVQPDDWRFFQTQSMLGEALAGQQRWDEAEPLLLGGFDGMQARAQSIPRPLPKDLSDAVHRLINFYQQTDQPDKVARWQSELKSIEAEMERLRQVASQVAMEIEAAENGHATIDPGTAKEPAGG